MSDLLEHETEKYGYEMHAKDQFVEIVIDGESEMTNEEIIKALRWLADDLELRGSSD